MGEEEEQGEGGGETKPRTVPQTLTARVYTLFAEGTFVITLDRQDYQPSRVVQYWALYTHLDPPHPACVAAFVLPRDAHHAVAVVLQMNEG